MLRGGLAALLVALALIAAPAAHAADFFVDQAIGSNDNSCTSTAAPCATIARGVQVAGAGDTIKVAPGIYNQQITLPQGEDLRATGPFASTILTSSALGPTVSITNPGTTLEGFTLRGPTTGFGPVVELAAAATVRRNVLDWDSDSPGQRFDIDITSGAGSPTVSENTFLDDGTGHQIAIRALSTGSPDISSNQITGFRDGIQVLAGSPTITSNRFAGIFNHPTEGGGKAILALPTTGTNVSPTIVGNLIIDPVTDGVGQRPNGIVIQDGNPSAGATAGATLRRNQILGYNSNVLVLNSSAPVTLDSDLLSGASPAGGGLYAVDNTGMAGTIGDVTATNVTSFGNFSDILLQDTHLTLDSSIVEDPIGIVNSGTCAITFSRGSTINGNSCQVFDTNADPQFVNSPSDPGPDDFHLQAGSPMINAGNTASPPAGTLDFDGDPRELATACPGTTRRDIGADETLPTTGCAPPDTQIDSGPAQASVTGPAPLAGFPSPTFAFSSPTGGFAGTFECSLDGVGFFPCSSPKDHFALSDGSHTFAVRATEGAGLTDASPAQRTWTVDGVAPDTQIASGPAPGGMSSPSPTFGFTSSEAGSTFQCSLDGAAFSSCPATHTPSGLANGPHTLLVRAIDAVGNTDPTQVSRTWNVDAVPPDTQIDSGPPDLTNDSSAGFTFSSEPGASFECSLDGGAFSPCTSPRALSGLSDGTHTLAVRASDAVGNSDPSPATRSWRVDTTPPDTEIASGPADGTLMRQSSQSFVYTSEPDAAFECSIDGGAFEACASPSSHTFADGAHTFAVRARDAAGNADESPASRSFTIDTTAPETDILGIRIRGDTARIRFAAGEAASFRCQLDGRAYKPCSSPKRFVKLFDGRHVVRIQATDGAGNVEPGPARKRFRIDE